MLPQHVHFLFFFNDTATTEIYTLSLHDALPISGKHRIKVALPGYRTFETEVGLLAGQKSEVKTELLKGSIEQASSEVDRKSTRLNSSHGYISYAAFCLKKKTKDLYRSTSHSAHD